MKILYLYANGRSAKRSKVSRGLAPSDFFYGLPELESRGYEVSFLDADERPMQTLIARLLNFLYYKDYLLPIRVTGDLLETLRSYAAEINRYDFVVATTTSIGFALELLRLVRIVSPKILTIHCGLLNRQYPPLVEKTTKILIGRSWVQVYGPGEYEGMMERYSIPPERIELNEFGIDTSFWTPNGRMGGKGQYILAVGNDGRRDYDLLITVAEKMGGHFKIVSSQKPTCGIPPNVELVRDRSFFWEEISDTELRELYRGALCVVVPLVQSQQPSGQSVTLQAMACGTPVILTRTLGLWSPKLLVPWTNIVLVDIGNAAQLEEAIKQLQRDDQLRCDIAKQAYELVCSTWTIDKFSERVVQMLHRGHNPL